MFPIHDDNPIRIIPFVNYLFMAVCVVVFLWQITQDPHVQQAIVYSLGVIPAVLFGKAELAPELAWIPSTGTVFTSMFLHGGWMHIIGNMLYLWVFGNNIEAAMGHIKFAIFYALCGVAAVFAQALPDIDSGIPMIGASGAISGILGAYLLLYPMARVTIIVPIFFIIKPFKVPAMLVLGAWFLMQLYSSFTTNSEGGGVAFGAHIGGFIAGMVLIPFFKNKSVRLEIPFVHFNPLSRFK